MGRYQASTAGECARMLTEDAEHAVLFEVRALGGDGGTEWVTADIDPMAEVGEVCRELAHHLRKARCAARAMEIVAEAHGIEPGLFEFASAMVRAEAQQADDWAWVRGADGED